MSVTRIQLESVLSRIVRPPLPWYPKSVLPEIQEMSDEQLLGAIVDMSLAEGQFFPLSMRLSGGTYWQLPQEPFINLSGKNTVIRRNVAKTSDLNSVRGTVKERWSGDDYSISISGVFRNVNSGVEYPRAAVEKLRSFCEAREVIEVECPLLEIFDITRIVIESYEIPFTPGEDMQNYSISAYSDFAFELLIDTE